MQVWMLCMVIGCAVHRAQSQGSNDTSTIAPAQNHTSVGFSVRKAFTINGITMPATPFNVQFKDVLANEGDGWSVDSSEFVAPAGGGYFFAFNAMTSKTKNFTVALLKNGVYQVTAFGKLGYNMAGNSALLMLNAGDAVSLAIQDGQIYENPLYETYTTFTGFKVF